MSSVNIKQSDAAPEVRKLTIIEISEGDSYSFEVLLTEAAIDAFAQLTGDVSTLHINSEFAQSRGFETRVCHGALLGGLFSRLVGVHLPGENALLQMMNLKFHQPAYAGMTLIVTGTVSQVSDSTGTVVLKGTIDDQRTGATLAKAKIQVGLTE